MLFFLKRKPIPAADRAAIRVPILILAGEQDQTFPLEASKEWQDGFTSGALTFSLALQLVT